MNDAAVLVDRLADHVKEARRLADEVRHNEKMHRVAMNTVFVLQDCHEALVRGQDNAIRSTDVV